MSYTVCNELVNVVQQELLTYPKILPFIPFSLVGLPIPIVVVSVGIQHDLYGTDRL